MSAAGKHRKSVAPRRGISDVFPDMATTSSKMAKPPADALLSLLESSALACVQTDDTGLIRYWSPSAEAVFGWNGSEMLGRPVGNLFYDGDAIERLLTAGGGDAALRVKSGGRLEARIWAAPLRGAGNPEGRVFLVLDNTETKFLERALLEAAEREQRRIGQDLHDHLCQHLLGAAFSAKALAGALDRDASRHAPQLHDLARLINDAVTQARDISRGLHPVELDSAGLMAALQDLANRAGHSVPAQFRCEKTVLVNNPAVALNAYRIAQEAVAEGLQSGAKKISISLTCRGTSICMRIVNEGSREGELTSQPAGTAAKTLQYRAHAMSADLAMTFQPGTGTTITCQFPFKP
jgi:PAS domain S-box-containing protein